MKVTAIPKGALWVLPNDRPALIETDKMEAILTEIDADRADGGWCGLV